MEDLKVGDKLYLQDRLRTGKPFLSVHTILKKTAKQYVLEYDTRVRIEDLSEVGNKWRQYVIKPSDSFLAEIELYKARVAAKDAIEKLRDIIVNRQFLTKEQYESIVEFCKQFEDK